MKNIAYSILLGYLFALLFFKHCTTFAVVIFFITFAISLVYCIYVLINFRKL